MPLRDHFRPPVSTRASWEGFHGGWPMTIVQHMRKHLPPGYTAEPRVHLGAPMEIDVNTYELDDAPRLGGDGSSNGGTATATAALPHTIPLVAIETDLPDEAEYEVRVYDAERGRQLVAAIEIASPANKDRPDHRNAFVGKCAALLKKGVAVSVLDLVTPRHFNLFAELMAFVGYADIAGPNPPPVYAASCRWVKRGKKNYLEASAQPLTLGQPLPTIPLWLAEDLVLPLDLEPSYEQACHDLWIT